MPALQIIALDTATPQLRAPATGDTYLAPRAIAITPEALTGSAAGSSLDIAQTWNTTGTPTALKLNVTDTASNANSLLMDLQVGGSGRLSVRKTGAVLSKSFIASSWDASGQITLNYFGFGLELPGNRAVAWNDGIASSGFPDVLLYRDAAATLAQRNGANAQTFRIYNTTDSGITNYERGFVGWSSNTLRIGTEKGGTGTARALEFQTDGVTRLTLSTTGNATFSNRLYVNSTSTYLESDTSQLYVFIGGRTAVSFRQSTNFSFSNECGLSWASGTDASGGTLDLRLSRAAANILRLGGNQDSTTGGAMEFFEMTAPAAPAANNVRIYAVDNGSGKTQLMALFATGAAQQLAIEP